MMRILFFLLLFSPLLFAEEQQKFTINGEEIDFSGRDYCSAPETRNGIVRVDCSLHHGPIYFFDEVTGNHISICGNLGCEASKNEKERHACQTQCPPRNWPVMIPDCAGPVPEDIFGTWSFVSAITAFDVTQDSFPWHITIDAGSMRIDHQGVVQIDRSFSIIEANGPLFIVELKDEYGETETISIELVECGIHIESKAECNAFCKNFNAEFTKGDYREILNRIGFAQREKVRESILETTLEAAAIHPVFPERSFFREVSQSKK